MAGITTVRRILLAIDPLTDDWKLQKKTVRTVNLLAEKYKAEVHVAYSLHPDQLDWTGSFRHTLANEFRPLAEEALAKACAKLNIHNLKSHKVLLQKESGLRKAVGQFAKYATKIKADLVVVATHGKGAGQKLIMGSFAETLLNQCPLPILSINPNVPALTRVDSIICPVDFSEQSKGAFDSALALAKQLKAELILFHALMTPTAAFSQAQFYLQGSELMPIYVDYREEEQLRAQQGEKYLKLARAKGVKAHLVVDRNLTSVSEAIAKFARKRRHSLICMGTQKGPVSATMIGSVARQVIKLSPVPVINA